MKFTYSNGGRVVKALQWVITTAMFIAATAFFVKADGYGAEANMVFGLFGSIGYLAYVTSIIAKSGDIWGVQVKVSDMWLNLVEVVIAIVWLILSAFLCLVSRNKIDITVPVEAYIGFGAIYGAGLFSLITLYLAEKDKNGKEGLVLVGLSMLIWWPAILGLISYQQGYVISAEYGYSHQAFPMVMMGASIFLVAFNSFGEALLSWLGRRAAIDWRPTTSFRARLSPPTTREAKAAEEEPKPEKPERRSPPPRQSAPASVPTHERPAAPPADQPRVTPSGRTMGPTRPPKPAVEDPEPKKKPEPEKPADPPKQKSKPAEPSPASDLPGPLAQALADDTKARELIILLRQKLSKEDLRKRLSDAEVSGDTVELIVDAKTAQAVSSIKWLIEKRLELMKELLAAAEA